MSSSSFELGRESKYRFHLLAGGIVTISCVVLFYELGDSNTLGSHEAFTAVPVREMLRSGDWIIPRYGGIARLEKPPLVYWVAATSAAVCGQISEWSVRLPFAISAFLLAALIAVWAARWYGRESALFAGLVQATSVWTIIYGRKAEVDMLLCLLITASLFLLVEQPADGARRQRFARWIGIYTLLSLAWMGKFHFGVAMVMVPCVAYFCTQKRFRDLLSLANPVGLALLGAAVVVWPYLVLRQFPNAIDVWRGETVGRAVGTFGHEPIWFYIRPVFSFALPWMPVALYAVPSSFRRAWKQGEARERFLWIWFFGQLAVACVSANKHRNYILPMLPVFSLLAAQGMSDILQRVRHRSICIRSRTSVILSIAIVAGMIGAWCVLVGKWPHLTPAVTVVTCSFSAAACATIWLLNRQRMAQAGYAAIIGFLVCYVGATGWILPGRDHRAAVAYFGKVIRSQLPVAQEVCVYRLVQAHGGKHPIVFYLDDPVSRVDSKRKLQQRIAQDGQLYVVTYKPTVEELSRLGNLTTVKTMVTPTGFAPFRGPPLVLVKLTTGGGSSNSGSHADAENAAGRERI